ncbi:MAG: RNA-binding transcriptional accessory protein [Desulfobacteraceae bacterium]|jgi:uncharacterized protein|nr:MAG: RNA-binding transcriptional accessory protein [Desulfobacteraceae bacterium]
MNPKHIEIIALELSVGQEKVDAASRLLMEGATVPFIARYRKEHTGGLDEVAIASIRDRMEQLDELDKRREVILKSLKDQGVLDVELEKKVLEASSMSHLEDIYLPFRPKRRTRATVAKEKGLEPLADRIMNYESLNLENDAGLFINPEKGVLNLQDALAGARDIIAERISEHQEARAGLRRLFGEEGVFICKVVEGKEAEGAKYRDYFDWQEPVSKAPSHRILAMRRGEKEGILTLKIAPPEDKAISLIDALFVRKDMPAEGQVSMAVEDAYRRLLAGSMETEIRTETKKRADQEAISVFASNLRQLLLSPPLGERRVMGIDPGFRTGCKLVCLNPQGKLLHNETIYPLLSDRAREDAGNVVRNLCARFGIEAIAVGNGTGGRETENFLRGLSLDCKILIIMVNESGASVYSASEAGREEFPDYDLTVRGAVSIGRRLIDPLAELVKIEPKAIGIGQYQHDVDQKALKKSLDDVVISCVNAVGVDVNTASRQLLSYVSGLGPQLARNIVVYRDENGSFKSREDLKRVPRMGAKTFEQAAGFLRVRGAVNPLDESAVHPESYSVVEAMARDLECTVGDLIRSAELRKAIRKERYISDTVGMPTLDDIINELAKPGRDPRTRFEKTEFTEGVEKIEDLEAGMLIHGVVTNVTAFGAFVDVGVHQDGLVHISELADRFVKDPTEIVKVQQRVKVKVLSVDLERRRVSLSMKSNDAVSRKKEDSLPQSGNTSDKNRTKGRFNNPFKELLAGSPGRSPEDRGRR